MRKKVSDRRSKESRFRQIESILQSVGEGGLRVAGVSKQTGLSKSYAHKLLLEMVDEGLIERCITQVETDRYYVNYVYYQMSLWEDERNERRCWVCDAVILHNGDRCSDCVGV